jgi:FkbM family methyltransferase
MELRHASDPAAGQLEPGSWDACGRGSPQGEKFFTIVVVKPSWILAAAIVLLAGAAASIWRPPFRLFFLAVTGNSPVCPWTHALRSSANRTETLALKDRILASSRLLQQENKLELWQTPQGRFWIPEGNRYVLPFNLAEMERHIYGQGEHFIHAGDIVLDCGASIGDFTREALRAGAAKVVAIEISPSSVECLRRNVATEVASGRVTVYTKGVWDRDAELTLNVDDANFAANSVALRPSSSRPSILVPVTTIDRIVQELQLPRVDFIKMDVEGAEARAIAGARKTLARFKPRLAIATEHRPGDERTIPAAVRRIRPDYAMECGQCMESGGHIRPDVLFFY